MDSNMSSKFNLVPKSTNKIIDKSTTKAIDKISHSANYAKFFYTIPKFQNMFLNCTINPKRNEKKKKYFDETKRKIHIFFKRKTTKQMNSNNKNLDINIETVTKSFLGKILRPTDKIPADNVQRFYMPVMVVADKSFVDFHREMDYETYILTAMNMVMLFFTFLVKI